MGPIRMATILSLRRVVVVMLVRRNRSIVVNMEVDLLSRLSRSMNIG